MTKTAAASLRGTDDLQALRARLRPHEHPAMARSVAQIATSIGAFVALSAAMYLLAEISLWLALAPLPLAAFLLVRVFIVQHDCGHGSFFRSRRANDMLGHVCSLLTLTPYLGWRRQHAQHHGVWNNLDRRASGADIYSTCLTVEEYLALGPWQRRLHRLTRHPLVANLLLPPFIFVALYRLPFDMPAGWDRERRNVHLTNLALVLFYGGLVLALGWGEVAAISLGVMVTAAIIGVWLFAIQHRFEGATWQREDRWSFGDASIEGTSHLRLGRVLGWLTGNIGLHHIHHLAPRIPNYALQESHDAVADIAPSRSIGLREALGAMRFTLWDEANERMATFRTAHRQEAALAA
jgi:omega-6 fatty acid desaturase (delta-12 desaturase)